MTEALLSGNKRNLGTYIAGVPGQGKSSLIQRMALHDIKNRHGVCVIDPTADLAFRILNWIPKSRVKDTIWFDTDTPIAIDFFSYQNAGERQVLTDQLVSVFQLDGAPIAKPRLGDILTALFDANEKIEKPEDRFTFLHISDFILSEDFREEVFKICPARRNDWVGGFPALKDMSVVLPSKTGQPT